jgi:hypothetical protein
MEISDSPAFQAYLRARADFTSDAGVRALEAWREINAVSWRLARLQTEAVYHTAHALLHCADPLQVGVILAKQVQPGAQRLHAWQERVLDLLGGAQAELAAIAESYMPTVRNAAAALPD